MLMHSICELADELRESCISEIQGKRGAGWMNWELFLDEHCHRNHCHSSVFADSVGHLPLVKSSSYIKFVKQKCLRDPWAVPEGSQHYLNRADQPPQLGGLINVCLGSSRFFVRGNKCGALSGLLWSLLRKKACPSYMGQAICILFSALDLSSLLCLHPSSCKIPWIFCCLFFFPQVKNILSPTDMLRSPPESSLH